MEYKSLGEIGSYVKSKVPVSSVTSATYTGVECLIKDFGGRRYAESIPATGKCTEVKSGDVLLGNIRPNLRKIWLSDCDGGASNDVLVFRLTVEPLLPKYLYYTLAGENFFDFNMQHARGGKMPRGNKAMILTYQIPVPPMEIQQEIVRILDSFAELEARRAQYAYYRDKLLDFTERESVSWLKLGEFATVNTGSKPKTFDESSGLYEFINAGTTPSGYLDDFNTEGDTVTTPSRGQGGIGYVGYSANRFWCGPLCYRIKSSDEGISNKYLYYVMQGRSWKIRTLMKEGGTPAINARDLKQLEIPVPPLSEQRRIVDILDRFEALTTSLTDGIPAEIEARRQQYEYYRDKLLDFPRKVA